MLRVSGKLGQQVVRKTGVNRVLEGDVEVTGSHAAFHQQLSTCPDVDFKHCADAMLVQPDPIEISPISVCLSIIQPFAYLLAS